MIVFDIGSGGGFFIVIKLRYWHFQVIITLVPRLTLLAGHGLSLVESYSSGAMCHQLQARLEFTIFHFFFFKYDNNYCVMSLLIILLFRSNEKFNLK